MTIVDILRDIVESLTFTEDIDTIVDNGDDTYDIFMCKTYHQSATDCKVTLDGNQYRVTGVVVDEKVTIQDFNNAGQPNITTWTISAPHFFHGTALDVNQELVHVGFGEKWPMVYLVGGFRETVQLNEDLLRDRDSNIRYFMLDQINLEDWKTKDHYENVIKPMIELEKEIIESFRNSKFIANLDETYSRRDWVKFGLVKDNEGNTKTILNELASGVENQISLPILKEDCKKC